MKKKSSLKTLGSPSGNETNRSMGFENTKPRYVLRGGTG